MIDAKIDFTDTAVCSLCCLVTPQILISKHRCNMDLLDTQNVLCADHQYFTCRGHRDASLRVFASYHELFT